MITLADGPLAGQQVQGAPGSELWACAPVADQPLPGPFYCYRYRDGQWRWVEGPTGRAY